MLAIKGIRISQMTISTDAESGKVKIGGTYQLISSKDTVLADQDFGDENYYGSKKSAMPMSQETMVLANKFIEAYKADISKLIGLDTE